uniref:UDP-glucuronosyltransferase 2B33 n=1 Tax=Lygus hesperus TaxID=30085 RepID=A0A0A9WXK0_LYGHE
MHSFHWMFFLTMVGDAMSAKILVLTPMPWKSHHFVFQSIIKSLAARGHHVDYLTPLPMKNPPPNVRNLLVKDRIKEQMDSWELEDIYRMWLPRAVEYFRTNINLELIDVYKNEPVIKELLSSNETYDMVMSESQLLQEISAVWAHRFNALPVSLLVIGEVSFANLLNGLPDNPSYMVDYNTDFTDEMGFWNRVNNFLEYVLSLPVHFYKLREQQMLADEILRYPGWEGRPSIIRLASDQALVLVNNHVAVSYAYPKAPHVKDIGGMTLDGSTELPQDLKSFMDNASDGVVYFSLGSMVDVNKLTRNGKLQEFLSAFRSLKQRVLFKWDGDNMPDIKDEKIRIQEWFPQLGILAHNNTKVFVSHNGLQSTMETVYFGVPVVSIPIFEDQLKNAKFLVKTKCAIELDKRNLTREALEWAINEVADNPKYKEAIMKRSAILRDVPIKHSDEAVYWVEYVLRHGRVLQPAVVQMPFYQAYLIDVLAFIITVICLSILLLVVSFKSLRSAIRSGAKTMKSKHD